MPENQTNVTFYSGEGEVPNEEWPRSLHFNMQGNHIADLTKETSVAREAEYSEGGIKYFLKASSEDNELFHPGKHDINAKHRYIPGKNMFQDVEVSSECFNLYLEGLRNNNNYQLNQAAKMWKQQHA